jgi:hypothetical protein
MPGFDGMGPMGKGSGTGRGFGYCRFSWRASREERLAALKEYRQALVEALERVEAALKNPDAS